MIKSLNILACSSVLCFALLPGLVQSQAQYSQQMQQMLDKLQYEEAYNHAQSKGSPLEEEFALWKGVAAQGVGRLNESEELLESFIRNYPNHPQVPRARLELGFTLVLLGEMRRAEAQLAMVMQANPPPNVQAKIKMLRSMAAVSSPWQFSSQFEAGLGHDSNANAGVTTANMVLPTLGAVTIDAAGLKTPADFQMVNGVGSVAYRWDRRISLLAVGSLEAKSFQGHSELNQLSAMAGWGGIWQHDHYKVRLLQLLQQLQLGGVKYRDHLSTNLEWTQNISSQGKWTFLVTGGRMDYGSLNATRNARVSTYALEYTHSFNVVTSPVASVGLSDSKESSRVSRPEFGRKVKAVKMALSLEPAKGWTSGLHWTRQDIDHDGADPLYALIRSDQYKAQGIFVGQKLAPNLSWQLDLQRLRNVSNIEVWTHDRNILTLKLRTTF